MAKAAAAAVDIEWAGDAGSGAGHRGGRWRHKDGGGGCPARRAQRKSPVARGALNQHPRESNLVRTSNGREGTTVTTAV